MPATATEPTTTNANQQPSAPPQSPPAPAAGTTGTPATVDFESLGVTKEQYEKLIASGAVIPKPSSLDQLPPEVQRQVDEAMRSKSQEVERQANERLYASIEKLKSDNTQIRQMFEAQEAKVREEEEAKRKAQEAERMAKATVEEKIEAMQSEFKASLDQISSTSVSKIQELETQLRVERLQNLRQSLITQAGGQILPDLIPDPSVYPNVTEEMLQEAAVHAKQVYSTHYEELKAKARAELEAEFAKQQSDAATTSTATQAGQQRGVAVPPGNAHLHGTRNVDLSGVRTAGRDELEKLKDDVLRRHGFA